jgi:hypothetical protein
MFPLGRMRNLGSRLTPSSGPALNLGVYDAARGIGVVVASGSSRGPLSTGNALLSRNRLRNNMQYILQQPYFDIGLRAHVCKAVPLSVSIARELLSDELGRLSRVT